MKYGEIREAVFLERPNRFIAHALLDGERVVCHVKNTGRCRELLLSGCTVYLEVSQNPNRKTKYDLVAVRKGERLINMDSQAPNRVAAEYLPTLFPDAICIRPETVYGKSRFDFYVETPEKRIFVEVKGVTLEADGVVLFPDAPTERGVKHLYELAACVSEGYEGMILFVIQMSDVRFFAPNDRMHPAFGDALRHAARSGVAVLAVECGVTPDSMQVRKCVPVRLSREENHEKNA